MNNKNDFYDDLYKNHKYDGVYKNDYYNKIMKKDKHKPGSVLVAIICIIFGALIFPPLYYFNFIISLSLKNILKIASF